MRDEERIEIDESSWLIISPIERVNGPPIEKQVSIDDRYGNSMYIGRIAHIYALIDALNKAAKTLESEQS